MGRVKDELFDAELDAAEGAWEGSPDGQAELKKLANEIAAVRAEGKQRERLWAANHSAEWEEWLRILPLLNTTIEFGASKPFEFDDFLMEVGRRPSPNHVVVRRDECKGFQQGNMVWAAQTPAPPKSPYLNVKEAAAYLGVAVRTVYNNRKHIPALPGFRTLMFDPKVLDQVRASPRFRSKRRKSRPNG